MEYLIGVGLAVLVCAFAALVGFDRDRVFYPTVVIVNATYYILFAVMGSSIPALMVESLITCVFAALAVAGFKKNLWLIGGRPRRPRSCRLLSSPVHSESRCPGVVAWILSFVRRFCRRIPCRAVDTTLRLRLEGLKLRPAAQTLGINGRPVVFSRNKEQSDAAGNSKQRTIIKHRSVTDAVPQQTRNNACD